MNRGREMEGMREEMIEKVIEREIEHRWASTSALMSAISDIDISYSDIGTKYVGLNPFIPISE